MDESEATPSAAYDDGGDLIDQDVTVAPPVLTINLQSWATPVAAGLMLIIGLLAGYYSRPLIEGAVASTSATSSSIASSAAQSAAAESPPRIDSQQRAEIMQSILPQVRHFRGDPDAPITLIEFSDFQ